MAIPGDPNVYLVWPADPSPEVREGLESLCGKVIRVGHSASLVQAWVEDAPPAPNLIPTEGLAQRPLRVSGPGRLEHLAAQYQSSRRPERSRWVAYAPAQPEPPPEISGSLFDGRLLVLRRVSGSRLGLESTLILADKLRSAVVRHCPQPVPEWVSGHTAEGRPSQRPHLALLPLPFVANEHADGHLLGLALAMPKHLEPAEMGRCLNPVLEHHLKELKLPTFLREYRKLAAQCAQEGSDHPDYLLRLSELELIDRHQRMVQRRIRAARFPAVKSLDTFDFLAIPLMNKQLVMELARCEYIERRENVIAVGNSGTGKTHVALGLGLVACQRGMSVGFTTAAALVHELMEARDDRRLLNVQRQLARLKLLSIDELGFVPRSTTGAELLFEVFSQRYEPGSILVATNLPFDEWTDVFGSERLTGALMDRLTHHVHILEMNGDSYRLKGSRENAASQSPGYSDYV